MNLLFKLLESAHETYRLRLLDGHPIAEIHGAQVLVDTGAPKSLGIRSTIDVGGHRFDLSESFMGQNIREISDMVGHRIDVLLGSDILGRLQATIDVNAGVLSFSREKTERKGKSIPFKTVMDVPVIPVALGDQHLPVFFDTGAKLSYMASHLLKDCPIVKTASDFYPGFGTFETPVRNVMIKVADIECELEVGVLPPLLEMSLLLGGVQGILGSTILKSHAVTLNFAAKQIEFKAHSQAQELF